MIFERITKPAQATEIIMLCTFREEAERSIFALQLLRLLEQRPEVLFIYAAFDKGPERLEVVGFVIAELMEDRVWITQAYSDPEQPQSTINNLFHRVKCWAVANDVYSIQAQTSRSVSALDRRFGFKVIAEVIEHRVDKHLLDLVPNKTE